jgi:hypothetical protein
MSPEIRRFGAVGKPKILDRRALRMQHERARQSVCGSEYAVTGLQVKPKTDQPIAEEAIRRLAEENNFPSRQAPRVPREPRRKRRVYTTGRNRQFNIKATPETVDRFYRMADERKVALCSLLAQALDALERAAVPEYTCGGLPSRAGVSG